jgi:hypothetical protein
MNEYIGYHFLASPDRLGYSDNRRPEKGVTMRDPDLSKSEGELKLCKGGFHACTQAIDALQYAPGSWVAKVKLSGTILKDTNKACATERTPLTSYVDLTRKLHLFAIGEARRALHMAKVKDERCWNVLKMKLKWLLGKVTDDKLAVAREAAQEAAREAAWAAQEAAEAANERLTRIVETALRKRG